MPYEALERIKVKGFKGRHGHSCLYDVLSEAVELSKPLSFLEIGVYDGASLFTVLNGAPQITRVVLCDIFNQEYQASEDWPDRQPGSAQHIRDLLRFLGYQGETEILIEDSRSAIPRVKGSFDLIHIDGNHKTEYALSDFRNCFPLLKSGGYLVMDDTTFQELKPVCEEIELSMIPVLTLTDDLSGSTLYQKPFA